MFLWMFSFMPPSLTRVYVSETSQTWSFNADPFRLQVGSEVVLASPLHKELPTRYPAARYCAPPNRRPPAQPPGESLRPAGSGTDVRRDPKRHEGTFSAMAQTTLIQAFQAFTGRDVMERHGQPGRLGLGRPKGQCRRQFLWA